MKLTLKGKLCAAAVAFGLLWFGVFSLLHALATTTITTEIDGNQSIASGANTISLSRRCSHVIVKLSSGSSSVYCTLNHGTTASNSNFLIDSGGTIAYGLDGKSLDATDQINYYGNGTTGTISYIAW